ncbi:hypothetical protein SK128_024180, partial [Halocaridina rubra]
MTVYIHYRPSQSVTPSVALYEIASASRNDEGTYQCSAKNAAGMSEERLQLIIDEDGVGAPVGIGVYPSRPGYTRPDYPDTRPEYTDSVYSVPTGGNFELKCS